MRTCRHSRVDLKCGLEREPQRGSKAWAKEGAKGVAKGYL